MKENKYDDPVFFEKYSQMTRSQKGLEGAGEWEDFRAIFPPLAGRSFLDLGCGYGWHCQYALEQGAASVTGVDLSEKMLAKARELTDPSIHYIHCALEDYAFVPGSVDVMMSSLTLHYIQDLNTMFQKMATALKRGGDLAFSIEHPIFTAEGKEDWIYDENGKIVCWPVDRYFDESLRESIFLGEKVVKYHHTMTSILNGVIQAWLTLTAVKEAEPASHLRHLPEMQNELRRPMMLLVCAHKQD